MPRHHKRRLGAQIRRNYSLDNLELALESVIHRNLSFRQAAERYGVPRNTIFRRYHGMNLERLGRPPGLNPNEEKTITDALTVAAEFGYPLTDRELREFVQHYLNGKGVKSKHFKNNLPGVDWLEGFKARNNQLSVRLSQNVKRSRAELTPAIIESYFNNLRTELENVPPENIINFDESNITDDPGSVRVWVKRKSKRATRIINTSKSSTSIMFAASANGEMLPPYIVYKAKNLYPEWVIGGPQGAAYHRSKSGWFDALIFEDWYFKIALPCLRRKEGKKILIGDNLSSHLSQKVVKSCTENNIRLIFLPPNSTHLTQPLDVSVFGPMKRTWRKILNEWKLQNRRESTLPKSQFPGLLNKLMMTINPTLSENIKSGFAGCGICPFDPQRVLNKLLPRTAAETNNNTNALVESFSNIMERQIGLQIPTRVIRRKKINVAAGLSVQEADFNEPIAGPSEEIQQETQEDETDVSDVTDRPDSDDDNPTQHEVKTPATRDNIEVDSFVVAEFMYNQNTKKETTRLFVAKILEIIDKSTKTELKLEYKIDCMRNYRGRKNQFIYPDEKDVVTVPLNNVKFVLSFPTISRGIHTFQTEV